jgi:hypothetical protein
MDFWARHEDYHTHISSVYPQSNLQRALTGTGIHISTICWAIRLPLHVTEQVGWSGDASDSQSKYTRFEFRWGHTTIFAYSFHGFPQFLQGLHLQIDSDSSLPDRFKFTQWDPPVTYDAEVDKASLNCLGSVLICVVCIHRGQTLKVNSETLLETMNALCLETEESRVFIMNTLSSYLVTLG